MSSSPENTILFLNDYAKEPEAISQLLQRAGYRVVEVGSAGEVWQQVKAARPQLILLDSKQSAQNGYAFCRELKSDSATLAIPVLLLLEANVGSVDRLHGLESGADAYLGKPVEEAELLATVKALLRMHQAEDRFYDLVNALEAVVWEADVRTGCFTFVSHQAEQVLGYPVERWLCEPDFLRKLIHPDDYEMVSQKCREATAAGQHHQLEYRVIDADNRERWLRDLVHVITDSKGEAQLLRGVMVDITGRKQSEAENATLLLRQQSAYRQAEEANQLKDEFLSLVSHELRAPLNSIQGWVRLLREGRLDAAETARALETIDNSARAQNKIINNLLDISRIITGKLLLNLRPVSPVLSLKAAIEAVRPTLETKDISLEVKLGQADEMIYADGDRLQQVFWNLLSNAAKFTPNGGRVTIETQRHNNNLEIRVSDTGPGITPEFLPYVFDRFRQQDGSLSRRHGGLGLGLALVRHLIEMHCGTVRAESGGTQPGATFIVSLPLLGEASPPSRVLFQDNTAGLDGLPELKGLRVLVVTEDEDTRQLIEKILLQCGGRVFTAATAPAALEIMAWPASRRPEILISDIEMSGMDGYQLVGQLRSRSVLAGGAVPAVALLAHARLEDRLPALAAGFQMHVVKPVDEYELVTVVASLAGRLNRRAEERLERH